MRMIFCAVCQATHDKLWFSMDFHTVSIREHSFIFLKCSAGNPSSEWKRYCDKTKNVPVGMLITGWLIPPLQRKVTQYAQQFLLLFATECQSSKHRTGTDQCIDLKIIQYEFSKPRGTSDSVNPFSFLLPLSVFVWRLETSDIHETLAVWPPSQLLALAPWSLFVLIPRSALHRTHIT